MGRFGGWGRVSVTTLKVSQLCARFFPGFNIQQTHCGGIIALDWEQVGLQGCTPWPHHSQQVHGRVGAASDQSLQELRTIPSGYQQVLDVVETPWLGRDSGKPGLSRAG